MARCRTSGKVCGRQRKFTAEKSSWISAILIVLLPKCPFCVMAYSGAMSLCSGKMLYPNAGNDSIYFIAGLALVILAGILFNYKGRRTVYSLVISSIGIGSLILSQLYWFSESAYYLSLLIIILGIWNNGSLHYFLKNIEKLVLKHKTHSQL